MSIGNNAPVMGGPQPAGRNWKLIGIVAASTAIATVSAGMWAMGGADTTVSQNAPQKLEANPGQVVREKEVIVVREPEVKRDEPAPQVAPQQQIVVAAAETFVSMSFGVTTAGAGYKVSRGSDEQVARSGGGTPGRARQVADGAQGKSFTIDDYRDSPGPNTMRRGDLWTGTALDEFSTDNGGPFRMLFNDPVYDSETQSIVLIPAGSTIYCNGSKDVEYGQDRGNATCDMLILPNNDHVPLGNMPATAESGSVGIPGEVDHHRGPLIIGVGAQVLGSMLSSAGQAFGNGEQTVVNVGVQSAGQGASTTIDKIMEQEIKRRNTITVHPGDPMGVRPDAFVVMKPWRG